MVIQGGMGTQDLKAQQEMMVILVNLGEKVKKGLQDQKEDQDKLVLMGTRVPVVRQVLQAIQVQLDFLALLANLVLMECQERMELQESMEVLDLLDLLVRWVEKEMQGHQVKMFLENLAHLVSQVIRDHLPTLQLLWLPWKTPQHM
jgi:hypothetical protein